LIEVSHLTKRYGDHTAVSDLSFTIEKGQIYGFLGPNGAGKSTTMNIMTGCLAATSGEVKIGGHDIFEEAQQAKRLIGYLPEQPPLYLDRTPLEYLSFVAEAKGVSRNQRKEEVQRVMEATQLGDVANRLIKNLSKGYKQRVGIAQALLGDPEIIILDEPTVGLDPRQIIEIRDLIQSLGKNHTVILSSHILSEVQAVCQTILIISKGKLVACDTPENLEKLFAGTATVELTAEATVAEVRTILSDLPYITELTVAADGDSRCKVRFDTDKTLDDSVCRDTFFAFAKAGRAILQMTMAKASLEDIFMELTGGDAPAQSAETEQVEEVEESEADTQ
jgi:ABC-2 type transport system ATP-binding protein